jgi:RNA polymerase sigma-70 factor (ECF subfamily)
MNSMDISDMRQELAQLGGGAHALATQILGNADDAADAVHDAFATVLARPAAFDNKRGALKPWFLRIVRNRCIDMIRRRRISDTDVNEIVTSTPNPEEALQANQRSQAIRRALAAIPHEKREVIILRDYLDLSYAEIAKVLDIASGTVMSRIHRARLALKEALENDGK